MRSVLLVPGLSDYRKLDGYRDLGGAILWSMPVGRCHEFTAIRSLSLCVLLFIQTNLAQMQPEGTKREAPQVVVSWLQQAAVPIQSTNPDVGTDDLSPLESAIGSAHVVALGEATHGTREFFQMKHRILRFLVERMGFTVFAIEANWPESLAVNDYVLNGTGDPAQLLAGLYFWTWNTEEVLQMIRWMRSYNQDPRHVKKIKFFGFDMQVTGLAVSNVISYFQNVDPSEAAVASEMLSPLKDLPAERAYPQRPAKLRLKTAEYIDALLRRFDEREAAYVKLSTVEAWKIARHNLEIVGQGEALLVKNPALGFAARDPAMAANVKWILDNEPPGTKIMLWAHNGHIAAPPVVADSSNEPMGLQLRKFYGNDLVICGFSFDSGSFQAKSIQQPKELRTFVVGPAIAESFDATLAVAGLPLFAIDLRAAPASGTVGNWLNATHRMRNIGAMYDEHKPDSYFKSVYPHSFDMVFFVLRTTAARANPKPFELELRGGS